MTIRSTITAIAFAAAIATAFAATAQAQSVSLDGYNLNSVEDIDRLHRAILSKVRLECGKDRLDYHSPARPSQIRQCVREAMDQTIGGAGLPMLTQFHASIDAHHRYDWRRSPMAGVMVASQ